MTLPRGIRNNNAGNLRYTPSGGTGGWRGAIPRDQATDKDYMQFDTAKNGLRAMAKLLWNYQRNTGLNTLREIIDRWAPPEDNNDTSAYVRAVSNDLNVGPDSYINVRQHLLPLVKAVVKHENGYLYANHYSDAEIMEAIAAI